MILDKWRGIWFDQNYLLNASVARIIIGLSALWNLIETDYSNFTGLLTPDRQPFYDPISILQFLGGNLPSPLLFDVIRILAYVSTIFFVIGLFTRISIIVSFITNLLLISLMFSWGGPWSHGENIVFLMHLAIIFTPCNLYLSLDSILFKSDSYFGPKAWNNGWGVNLAMVAGALMFANAGFYKYIYNPDLGWAFSDSLRNYIIQQYLIIFQKPIPIYLDWIVNNEIGYKTLALLNISAQLSMLGIFFFLKRPLAKLIYGILFFSISVGLYMVMRIESFKWWPLALVFVDWSWFLKNKIIIKKFHFSNRQFFFDSMFIVLFLGVYIITAFDVYGRLEKKYKVYPFSEFSMFSHAFANQPYNKHFPLILNGNEFKFFLKSSDNRYLDSLSTALPTEYYRYNYSELYDTALIKDVVRHPYTLLSRRPEIDTINSLEWNRAVFVVPAYPARAELKLYSKGLQGKVDGNGIIKIFTIDPIATRENEEIKINFNTVGYSSVEVTKVEAFKANSIDIMKLEVISSDNNYFKIKAIENGLYTLFITIKERKSGKLDIYCKLIELNIPALN